MNAPDLRGVIPPIVTPLRDGASLDEGALKGHVEHLIGAGVGGIFVLGSSGEGPWLTPNVQHQVVAAAVQAAEGRVPILAGVLEPGAARVIETADRARDAGADVIVVTTPYYFAVDDDAVLRHFERIIASVALPIMLYNIPQMTHCRLNPGVVRSLLPNENIAGIKDSAGDAAAFGAMIDLARSHAGFRVFQGAERQSLSALRAGAHGLVPGLANVAASSFVALIRAATHGAWDEAETIQQGIERLWGLHEQGPWLACLKRAVALTGFGDGTTLGGDELPADAIAAIRRTLERHEQRGRGARYGEVVEGD